MSLLLLGAPLRPLIDELLAGGVSRTSLALVMFTSIPVGVVILYGLIRQRREIQKSLGFARRFGLVPAELSHTSIARRFRNSERLCRADGCALHCDEADRLGICR